MFWIKLIVVAIAGALGAGLANRGIALFHDAARSIMPELIGGRMQRREFATLAFTSSFGLILGFGIPYSLASTIVLSHGLWLGTDIIGTWFPGSVDDQADSGQKNFWGFLGSIAAGAIFGILLVLALDGIDLLATSLPVNFIAAMQGLGSPVIFTLALIPALAITYQYGIKNGIFAFLITLVGRQLASAMGQVKPDGWAFLLGMLVLFIYAVQEGRCEAAPDETFQIDPRHHRRIRKHLPWIALLGALYGISTNLGVLMEGPQSLLAWAQGDHISAIYYTVARAIAFLPMRTMSILTTGVFTMEGLGLAPTLGLAAPNAVMAAIAGAAGMTVELLSLEWIAKFFNRYPCSLKIANSLRTAMTKLLEIASLVGGMLAANTLSPGFGFFGVAGLYLLNEAAGTPVVRAAVGPLSVILMGIILNLLALVHVR